MGDGEVRSTPRLNLDLERQVLGSALKRREAAELLAARCRKIDWASGQHRTIWEAVRTLANAGHPVDPETVAAELARANRLEGVGGRDFLWGLEDVACVAAHQDYYIQQLQEVSGLRCLGDLGHWISGKTHTGEASFAELYDQLESRLMQLRVSGSVRGFKSTRELAEGAMGRITRETPQEAGVPSGYGCIDAMTRGWQRSDFIVVAGRPSMGKTALGMEFAVAAARAGFPVAVFSLEMSEVQLWYRMVAAWSGVSLSRLADPEVHLHEDELHACNLAVGAIGDLPLHINDSPEMTLAEIRAEARAVHRKEGVRLILIDHLQRIVPASSRSENGNQDMTKIAKGCKSLARDLDIPVMSLSQLSRASERREDKRPILADLRESGTIEQEADLVALLYRGSYYRRGDQHTDPFAADDTEFIIAKQRNGQVGTRHLGFVRSCSRFVEVDQYHAGEEPPPAGKSGRLFS